MSLVHQTPVETGLNCPCHRREKICLTLSNPASIYIICPACFAEYQTWKTQKTKLFYLCSRCCTIISLEGKTPFKSRLNEFRVLGTLDHFSLTLLADHSDQREKIQFLDQLGYNLSKYESNKYQLSRYERPGK